MGHSDILVGLGLFILFQLALFMREKISGSSPSADNKRLREFEALKECPHCAVPQKLTCSKCGFEWMSDRDKKAIIAQGELIQQQHDENQRLTKELEAAQLELDLEKSRHNDTREYLRVAHEAKDCFASELSSAQAELLALCEQSKTGSRAALQAYINALEWHLKTAQDFQKNASAYLLAHKYAIPDNCPLMTENPDYNRILRKAFSQGFRSAAIALEEFHEKQS